MATEEQTTYSSAIGFHTTNSMRGQILTIANRTVSNLSLTLNKFGSPTGDITFTIRKVSDDSIIVKKVWGNASTLTGTLAWCEATFNTPVFINEEVRILAEFTGGNASNHPCLGYKDSDVKADECHTRYLAGAWDDITGWDTAYIYTYASGNVRTYTIPDIQDYKGRPPKGARVEAYRDDTHALVETQYVDTNGNATFTELPGDVDVSFHASWGGISSGDKSEWFYSKIAGVPEGGTGSSNALDGRTNLGIGTSDSPQFTAINLGHATDTTLGRTAAGRANIEGVNIVRAPASATDNRLVKFNLTTGDLIQQTGITADDSNNVSGVAKLTTSSDVELGHASDTTIHRESAGLISVEGDNLIRASDVDDTPVNGQTAVPVSSNWAFDHDAATTGVHGVGAYTFTGATSATVTLYVDAGSGNDGNAGTSGSPKATIQGALDALPLEIAYTCTICVRGQQNYPENNVALDFSRFDTLAGITIKAVNSSDEDMYDNGLASAGGNNTLTDDANGKSWSVDQFNGAYIWIYAGTGVGQVRTISDTTATVITVSANWTTNPDNTSYYVVGGGATMTGTAAYHVYIEGKTVAIYGFCHTGATSRDIFATKFAYVGCYYSYHKAAVTGILVMGSSEGTIMYNYIDATTIGIQAQASVTTPRANAVINAPIGALALYMGLMQMGGGASVNYFLSCTIGIQVSTGGGCSAASYQVFSGCTTDIDPAVSTTVPAWWN